MANDQTHDIQSKHSSLTEINNDESKTHLPSINNNNSPDINREDYQKVTDQISTAKSDKISINDQSIASPFDATNESTQSDNAPTNTTSSKKPLKRTVQDHSLNENDNINNRQRSVSSSSSTSSASLSSDNQTSNIPYEILNNDDDDDDDLSEHPKETTNQISS